MRPRAGGGCDRAGEEVEQEREREVWECVEWKVKSVHEEGEVLVGSVLVKRQEASDKNLREYEEWKEGKVVSCVERTELVRDGAVQKESSERNREIGRVECE